ncbi:MAG: hypothetical protein LBC13_01455, partial [Clostridiales bacterium]|nr:hypothetical protein [Clostridiales bacterium]
DDEYDFLPKDEYDLVRALQNVIYTESEDDVIEILYTIPTDHPKRFLADRLLIALHFENDEHDLVIFEGNEILNERWDATIAVSVAASCLLTERRDDAEKLLRNFIEKEPRIYMPIKGLMHYIAEQGTPEQNIDFFSFILEKNPFLLEPSVFLAQSLFNGKRVAEAVNVMKGVNTVYGKYSEAAFYIKYFTDPSNAEYGVPYGLRLPPSEYARCASLLSRAQDDYLRDEKEFARIARYDAEFINAIRVCLRSEDESNVRAAMVMLDICRHKGVMVTGIIHEYLREPFLNPVVTAYMTAFLLRYENRIDDPVVFFDKWQETGVSSPPAVTSLPSEFVSACIGVIADEALDCGNIGRVVRILGEILNPLENCRSEINKLKLQIKPLCAAMKIIGGHGGYGKPLTDEEVDEAAKYYSTKRPAVRKYVDILERLAAGKTNTD